MIKAIAPKFAAVFMALGAGALPASAAEALTFSGDVTYRERIALPENAELRLSLVAQNAPDRPIVGATALLASPGQVPLLFTFDVRSEIVVEDRAYGLIADILVDGQLWFTNTEPVPVDLMALVPVNILVQPAAQPAVQPVVGPN